MPDHALMGHTLFNPRRGAGTSTVGLLVFVLAVLLVILVSGYVTATAPIQYQALERPSWAPPPSVFGPVWTVLYVLIAVAGWLVWRQSGVSRARWALSAYVVQLVLNGIWTPLFFGQRAFGAAFVEICVLWVAIVVTIVLFARHSRLAAALLVPYLIWVTYAAALNFSIWRLNA